jgi:molybdopterin molybdotransferase
VRAVDTPDGEVALRINEVVGAGGWPAHRVEPGTATAIMTGAPVPDGADAIVMVEDTDGAREGIVHVRRRARPGQHVRRRGEDVRTGDVVLRGGERLTPGRLGLAASLGLVSVPVVRRPVVAILSTGDEVVPPGQPLRPGQIYSSNNAALVGLARDLGCVPRDQGIARDAPDALVAALREAASGADAVVTTGGVSVGAFDFVKDAFVALGGSIDFWKVSMKPGKPLAFGRVTIDRATVPLFGLPGNPVSCMVNFHEFVRPWLLRAQGLAEPFLPVIEALVAEPLREAPGRTTLVRVTLSLGEGGGLVCRPTGSQSSGVLGSMARAHGFAVLSADRSVVAVGERVTVQVVDWSFADRPDLGFAG